MAYLVDTNIVVDVTRGSITAADYLDSLASAWFISTITCLELLAGARTERSRRTRISLAGRTTS